MDPNEPGMGGHGQRTEPAMEQWNAVLDDMEATAEELSAAGWETLLCHPGDVTTVTKHREPGVDVLLSGDDYDELAAAIDAGVSFDGYEVYRAAAESVIYALIVAQDQSTSTAALVPVYLDEGQVRGLVEQDREEPGIPLYLRRLDGDLIELRLDHPSLLLEDGSGEA